MGMVHSTALQLQYHLANTGHAAHGTTGPALGGITMTLTMTDVVSVCVFSFSCQQTKDDPCCDNDAADDDYEMLFRFSLFFRSDANKSKKRKPEIQNGKKPEERNPKIKEAR